MNEIRGEVDRLVGSVQFDRWLFGFPTLSPLFPMAIKTTTHSRELWAFRNP